MWPCSDLRLVPALRKPDSVLPASCSAGLKGRFHHRMPDSVFPASGSAGLKGPRRAGFPPENTKIVTHHKTKRKTFQINKNKTMKTVLKVNYLGIYVLVDDTSFY